MGLPESTDEVWVRRNLKEGVRALGAGPVAPAPGAPPAVSGARPFPGPFQDLVEDMVATAPAVLAGLPTLDANVEGIVRTCQRRRRRAIVLLGPSRSGKSFSMEQLAARVRSGTVPDALKGISVLKVRLAPVMGSHVGESARAMQRLGEAAAALPRAILFFDELQGFVKSGNDGHQTEIVTAFKELVTSRSLPNVTFVAATTRREFDLFVRADPALERRFTAFQVKAPEPWEEEEAVRLQAKQLFPEAVAASDPIVRKALRVSRTAFPDRAAVDAALDLLDGARVRCSDPSDETSFLGALDSDSSRQMPRCTGPSRSGP